MTDLCRALGELGVWVRLHYVYPYPHVDEVIPLMAEGKILPYLDVPFQHASPRILKLMKRPASAEKVLERLRRWREICPDITVRTTFIVGFPGETEAEFSTSCWRSSRKRSSTASAASPIRRSRAPRPTSLPDAVPEEVEGSRGKSGSWLAQAKISAQKLQRKVGKTLQVLVDEPGVGRSSADAPEIDGVVRFKGGKPGEFRDVTIDRADEHDLYGRLQ